MAQDLRICSSQAVWKKDELCDGVAEPPTEQLQQSTPMVVESVEQGILYLDLDSEDFSVAI